MKHLIEQNTRLKQEVQKLMGQKKCSVGGGPLTNGLMQLLKENKQLKEMKQQLEEVVKKEHIQTVPVTKNGQPNIFSGENVAAMETSLPAGGTPAPDAILTFASNTTMPSPPHNIQPTCGPTSFDTQTFQPQTCTPNACGYEHLPAVHTSSSAIYSSPTSICTPSASYNSEISHQYKGGQRSERDGIREYPSPPISYDGYGYSEQPVTTVSVPVCHTQYSSSYSQALPFVTCCSGSYPAVMSGYSQEPMMTTAPVPVCHPQYGSSQQSPQVSPTTIATCCSSPPPSYQLGLYDGQLTANTAVTEPRAVTYNIQPNLSEPSMTKPQHLLHGDTFMQDEHVTMQRLKDLQLLPAVNTASEKTSHRGKLKTSTPHAFKAQQGPHNSHIQSNTPTYARTGKTRQPQKRHYHTTNTPGHLKKKA